MDKGVKFSILRKYFVLVINADFRKEGYTYNLSYGRLIRDNEGKIIRQAQLAKKKVIDNNAQGGPQMQPQPLNQIN